MDDQTMLRFMQMENRIVLCESLLVDLRSVFRDVIFRLSQIESEGDDGEEGGDLAPGGPTCPAPAKPMVKAELPITAPGLKPVEDRMYR